jgi:hypothetical protein
MRSESVVVTGVRFQNATQMRLAQHNHMIGARAPDGTDEPFGVSIVKSSQLHLYCVIGHKPS